MRENQYQLFRDLDRRCVAGGLRDEDCIRIVECKKQSIESGLVRENPVVQEILKGDSSFVEIYDSFSRNFRGLRRFVPHRHDDVFNARLEHFSRIVPNVAHFRRRSIFAADNPLSCTLYGVFAGLAADVVWARQMHETGSTHGGPGVDAAASYFLAVIFGFGGFVAGIVSMMRYRTRDPSRIHAREAAAYMDLNYGFYRDRDEEGWTHFIQTADDARRTEGKPEEGVPSH